LIIQAGKGGKGGKGGKFGSGKSKKAPQSRSARAGLQVSFPTEMLCVFTRLKPHLAPESVMIYDDNLVDQAGKLARTSY
jgi:hypothetical protein